MSEKILITSEEPFHTYIDETACALNERYMPAHAEINRYVNNLIQAIYCMGLNKGQYTSLLKIYSQLSSALGFTTSSSHEDNYSNDLISFIIYKWEDIIANAAVLFVEWQEERIMGELNRNYEISNWTKVSDFLKKHPYLVGFLHEASSKIRQFFGENVQIKLELVSDPEIEDETSLFAYVFTDLSVDEALSRLRKLDDEWFLDNVRRAKGRFNIDVAWH